MKRYVIERDIANVGQSDLEKCAEIARISNTALSKLAPRIQWEHSYFTNDKTFCVYLAENESLVHQHASLSGFPATRITEVKSIVDPTTAFAA